MNMRPFEVALIGAFALVAVIGLVALSMYEPESEKNAALYGDSIEIWGTFDDAAFKTIIGDVAREDKAFNVVSYTEKDARTFQNELLNAIAEGRSPDLIVLPHSLLATYRSKLQPISYETINERSFKDTYIDGAEIFMRSDGIYGIPFAADPLVMYWNRDIFSSAGLAQPPKTWEQLLSQTTKAITRADDKRNIKQSAVALGEYSNITHAKDILAMLLLQAGSTIVDESVSGEYSVSIEKSVQNGLIPGDAAFSFYTQFALPNKEAYSWNRSLYDDRTEFINGTLGLYFGKGSEYAGIERDNANINFDAALVPQGSGATIQRNYADFYAFAIPRASQNEQGAYAVAQILGNSVNAKKIADAYTIVPVHRALFGATGDAFKDVLYQSALTARGWLDPSPNESDDVFRMMVEGVLAGETRLKSIMVDGVHDLEVLFK